MARTPGQVPLDRRPGDGSDGHADPRAVNTAATAATHVSRFGPEFTGRLFRAARAHRCHPGELLLHALGEALGAWQGQDAVRVDVLRHGREEVVGDTDLARTTGWFTTTVPVRLDLAPGTPAERLARTVGHLAALPGGGIGHGALKPARPSPGSPPPCAAPRPATSPSTSRATTPTDSPSGRCCSTSPTNRWARSPDRTGCAPTSSR